MVKKTLIFLIFIYKRYFSLLMPSACRFYPTCSCYTTQAIEKYGAWKGGYLGLKRLLKCHPFHPGGYDPLV